MELGRRDGRAIAGRGGNGQGDGEVESRRGQRGQRQKQLHSLGTLRGWKLDLVRLMGVGVLARLESGGGKAMMV